VGSENCENSKTEENWGKLENGRKLDTHFAKGKLDTHLFQVEGNRNRLSWLRENWTPIYFRWRETGIG